MISWTAISSVAHAKARFRGRSGFEFASKQHVIEVLVDELAEIIGHFACGFIKDETGSYKLVALVGLGGARNLLVNQDNKWLCEYIPATLRGYPFALIDKPNSDPIERILCIDQSFLTEESDANPIFDEEGKLGIDVAEMLSFLNNRDHSRILTQAACSALDDAGVICPWELNINRGEDQEPQSVSDLYRVDRTALSKLDDSVINALFKTGSLEMAYAQLLSMQQIHRLVKYLEILSQQEAQTSSLSPVAGLLGDDEGSLNFDGF
jgi:hypothetical protein